LVKKLLEEIGGPLARRYGAAAGARQ